MGTGRGVTIRMEERGNLLKFSGVAGLEGYFPLESFLKVMEQVA
jgi:hypothetical protein